MNTLYKTPEGEVINISNMLTFRDITIKNRGQFTLFYTATGGRFTRKGHLTEDILAKQDVVKKMTQMLEVVKAGMNPTRPFSGGFAPRLSKVKLNSLYGKFARTASMMTSAEIRKAQRKNRK